MVGRRWHGMLLSGFTLMLSALSVNTKGDECKNHQNQISFRRASMALCKSTGERASGKVGKAPLCRRPKNNLDGETPSALDMFLHVAKAWRKLVWLQ